LAALVFGILAALWTNITLTILIYWFGAYVIWDGVFAIIAAIRQRGEKNRWWALLLEGVIGILAGLVTFILPGVTALVVIYLIAAWALFTGILELLAAVRLRKELENEWVLAFGGILSILFSIVLIVWPAAAAFALVWVIAFYSIVFGLLLIFLAFRVRNQSNLPQATTGFAQKQAR
jgi:uncharacterized membrane protein HdeD (DUF308 family)